MPIKKKILFITTASLSTNPRLLKELKVASDLGYEAHLLAFRLGNWSDKADKEHLKSLNCLSTFLSATQKSFWAWLVSSLIEKFARQMHVVFRKSILFATFAHTKRSFLLISKLQQKSVLFDLISAHTLGALFPAFYMALKYKIPFIFDIEDYHPGEKSSEAEKDRRKLLMKELLPKAAYLTYASPLIGEYSLKLLRDYPADWHQLINNCFSETEFRFHDNQSPKVKLVWFSQNISAGRGLEQVLPALVQFRTQIELTLIGNLYTDFWNDFLCKYSDFITVKPPMLQKDLNLQLAEFDIGLAVEISSVDWNKNIALSNKIFAYAQSGLFILATDTLAQTGFMNEHTGLGLVAGQNEKALTKAIGLIMNKIETIRKQKKERFLYAKRLSWEHESKIIDQIWQQVGTKE